MEEKNLKKFNEKLKKSIEKIRPKLFVEDFSVDYIPLATNFFFEYSAAEKYRKVVRISLNVKDKSQIYYL